MEYRDLCLFLFRELFWKNLKGNFKINLVSCTIMFISTRVIRSKKIKL